MKSFTDDKPIVISKQSVCGILSSGSKNEHRTSCLSKMTTVTKQYNLVSAPDMSIEQALDLCRSLWDLSLAISGN